MKIQELHTIITKNHEIIRIQWDKTENHENRWIPYENQYNNENQETQQKSLNYIRESW